MGAIFLDDQNYSAPSVEVDKELSDTSENPIANKAVKEAIDDKVSKETGKGLSTNDFTNEEKDKLDNINIEDSVSDKIDKIKGEPNGLASLDASGKVPSDQLPSYVDDVIEGYYNSTTDKFFKDPEGTKEIIGETGKIYLDAGTNKTYRWSGTTYIQVGGTDIDEAAFLHKDGSVAADFLTIGTASGLSGHASLAIGSSVNAGGNFSFAQGTSVAATNTGAHAEGSNTSADGLYSHAEGTNSKAHGTASHAEGNSTEVSSDANYGHTEGSGTKAQGVATHAEGYGSIATSYSAHAEGGGTKATGSNSHSEGSGTTASGQESHAEGGNTVASAPDSHAEGGRTEASGPYSHAEGFNTEAKGPVSHAAGSYTVAGYPSQTTIGQYNNNQKDTLFEVGNGISSTERSNAFEVYKDGHINVNGDIYQNGEKVDLSSIQVTELPTASEDLAGKVYQYIGDTTEDYTLGFFYSCIEDPDNEGSYIWKNVEVQAGGTPDGVLLADGSVAADYLTVGTRTGNAGVRSFAQGNEVTASGYNSHAEGQETTASGLSSHAEGNGTKATLQYCHAEGYETTASGPSSHAEGQNTKATAQDSHAEGCQTTASGEFSHAEGSFTIASGSYSHAGGNSTTASADGQTAIGLYNDNKTDTLFEVGNGIGGSGSVNRSNAFEVTSDGFIRTHNNTTKIAFGVDENGNYGYIKDGADTVTPFKKDGVTVESSNYGIAGEGYDSLVNVVRTFSDICTIGEYIFFVFNWVIASHAQYGYNVDRTIGGSLAFNISGYELIWPTSLPTWSGSALLLKCTSSSNSVSVTAYTSNSYADPLTYTLLWSYYKLKT